MLPTPWSKEHKRITGNCKYNLSNSYAQPTSTSELIALSKERGDQDIVDEYLNHSLDYTPNGGSEDLRIELAKLYGDQIDANNIIVFAGGQVGLQIASNSILTENSHAITFGPGYQSVQEILVEKGARTVLNLLPDNEWHLDITMLASALRSNTSYLVINQPHNPSGSLMSHETQKQLIELARLNDLYLFSDEVYRLLEYDPASRLMAMADVYSKGLSLGTFSKPWGGCGVTIGWIATQDLELKQKLIDIQYFGTACPARSSEILALMILRSSDFLLKRNLGIIKNNILLIDSFTESYKEYFEWIKPSAGAVGFMKFKGPFSSKQLGEELAHASISIKPSYVFTNKSGLYDQYFRIGFGERIFPEVLNALSDFVDRNKHKW